MFCANLVGPIAQMLQVKFQSIWPFGSRGEYIKRVFALYGHGSHLGYLTINICYRFAPLSLNERSARPLALTVFTTNVALG